MSQITTPTFIIGLGGIGNLVVRLVRERYLSTDTAIPDTLRLRSIDTADQSKYGLARLLPEELFTKAGDFDANGVIRDLDLFPLVKRWWKYPSAAYSLGFIENGAGAKRPVGRLVFFQQFESIHAALQADLAEPRRIEVQTKMIEQGLGRVKLTPRVFVIGSLAGGTCSGTFIDVAFLLRRMLANMGYEVSGASITGIFALPSVIHLASKDEGTLTARQRQINSHAALRDLDYLMRGWSPSDLRLSYPPPIGEFSPAQPLFNQLYLFTSANQQGTLFTEQEQVLQRVAHFIFGQVALGTGEETLQTLDNFRGFFDPSQRTVKDGMIAIYGAFGVEWLEVPHQQLIRSWCERVAPDVAARVTDLKWSGQPLKGLDRTLRERLNGPHEPYRLVLDLARAQLDDLAALPQAPDLQPFLAAVQNAKGKAEIKAALLGFEAQLPSLVEFVRSLARKIPSAAEDAAWVRRTAVLLMRDGEFRMGGARRLLEAAEARLNAVADLASEPGATVDEAVKKCGGGLVQKPDCGPAVVWIRARFLHQMRAALKATCGAKAATLAGRCRTTAHLIEELQQAVQEEVGGLAQGVNVNWQPQKENWLLDELEIEAAAGKAEAVAKAVAGEVSERLSQAFEALGAEPAHEEVGAFRPLIREVAIAAIELEAMRLTRRPENAVERLRDRMLACQPMAQIITQDAELRRVMRPEQVATPLKMVVTSLSGASRERLDRWAEEERRGSKNVNAFKIVHSSDPLRDDALSLSFGWPLWLFAEVRQCAEVFKNEARDNRHLTDFAPIIGEAPAAAAHDFRPVPQEQNRLLFAYAVVLGRVQPRALDEFAFDAGLFGETAPAASLEEAFEIFQGQGLNRTLEKWLVEQKRVPGAFKAKVQDRVKHIQNQLDVEGAIPDELRADLTGYARLVGDDVKKIVVL